MEQPLITESSQNLLMRDLLSKEISEEEFIEKVFALDQSTPGRDQSFENLKILENYQIREIFDQSKERSSYKNLLSLTYFHIGQIKAESNPKQSIAYFELASQAAEEVDWEGYEDWKLYVEATIAYFNMRLQKLEEIYSKIKEGRNKIVIKNLIQGLRDRGSVDYVEDYSK